ncbi:hypothetical protein [uncultured Paraglaciecola sp.]|nr:hypothetical protein [uncultured Paraglaciecola sp.]
MPTKLFTGLQKAKKQGSSSSKGVILTPGFDTSAATLAIKSNGSKNT